MLQAINNFVLIELTESGEQTLESGLILPELKDIPSKGRVISVGHLVPEGLLAPNDIVWFKMWSGEDIAYEDKKYKSVHWKDIMQKEN